MRRVKWIAISACAAVLIFAMTAVQAQEAPPKAAPEVVPEVIPELERAHKIQLAILLDTSGSMTGLIDQARAQLWNIVNEFATTKKDGKIPDFEVALYHYGSPSLGAKTGYVRRILPLTTDLDKVSEELFALRTSGGQEYCGTVIKAATEQLSWSGSNDDLKVIFIAGNEPFTQGSVDFRKACPAAIGKGIIVNTIFCGNHAEGISTHWRDGAALADGKYINIDGNAKAVHIAAPQDKEIERLGAELNKTYVAYGSEGMARQEMQTAQDLNAAQISPSSAVSRAISKSSAHYRNAAWDLIDAVRENKLDLADVKEADLPEEMKKMTPEEREAYVKKQAEARTKIQEQIKKLNAARNTYIAEERKKLIAAGENTLDAAIIKSVREQAVKKDFKVDEKGNKGPLSK